MLSDLYFLVVLTSRIDGRILSASDLMGEEDATARHDGGNTAHTLILARSPLESFKSILPSFGNSSQSTSSPDPYSAWPSIPIPDDPAIIGLLSALGGIGLALGGVVGYRRYWKRIRNSNDVTGRMLDQQRWIRGVVTSVGDGGQKRHHSTMILRTDHQIISVCFIHLDLSTLCLSRYAQYRQRPKVSKPATRLCLKSDPAPADTIQT